MSKLYYRNRAIFYFLLITNLILFIIFYSLSSTIHIDMNSINDNVRVNLLTLNTFFAGFLYNLLGNLIEFTTRLELKTLRVNGYLDKYFNAIYISIFSHVISIMLGFSPVFLDLFKDSILLYLSELWFMLNGVALLLYSLIKFKTLVNTIKDKGNDDEDNEE